MTDTASVQAPRPLNPLAALTLVLVFPGKTFRRLTERPVWVVPLVFVIAAVVLQGLLGLAAGFMDEDIRELAFLHGAEPAYVKAGMPVAIVLAGVVGIPVTVLIQTLVLMAAAALFRGRSGFRRVFGAVCLASVPSGVYAIALAALMPITRSVDFGIDLSFVVDPAASPTAWGVARQISLPSLWTIVLLAIAAEPVFGFSRHRARLATLVFAVISVVAIGLMGRSEAMRRVDAHADWTTQTTPHAVLHMSPDAPETAAAAAAAACEWAGIRAEDLTGVSDWERIDCYVYPSLGEKSRVTGNGAAVHGVEWAHTIHVGWEEGVEAALAREMFKLAGAKAHGKMYNPLIRDGLAVVAGGEWAGMPVRRAGLDLLERRVLPGLETLVDPVMFVRIDERISQPSAGSFMTFVMNEVPREEVLGLYAASTERPEVVGALLEDALGDSLGAIERLWLTYLESDPRASRGTGGTTPGASGTTGDPGMDPGQ